MQNNLKSILIFVIGLICGVFFTYYASISSLLQKSIPYSRLGTNLKDLYSNDHIQSFDETDEILSPDNEQLWNDVHDDENSTVANELFNKVKVLCWVMTNPKNIRTKAQHIDATWGKRCNKLLFMSSRKDSFLHVIGLNVREGRDHLWGKTKAAFKYIYHNHLHDADWFLKADDDTYVIVENLRYLLKDYNAMKPYYFGHRFKPMVSQGYMSGGAGYVLSKDALKKFVQYGIPNRMKCRQDSGGAEDVEMGKCLQKVGVEAMDSRDNFNRERFLPFIPEYHLIPGTVPKDNWYWKYNFYPTKEGPDCCSDMAVTFHYVPPNMMYVMEYLIYHLKPYGIVHSYNQTLEKNHVLNHDRYIFNSSSISHKLFNISKSSRSSHNSNLLVKGINQK